MKHLVTKAKIINRIVACRPPMRICCIGLLLDDPKIYKNHTELLGHSTVATVLELFEMFMDEAPDLLEELREEVRELLRTKDPQELKVLDVQPVSFMSSESKTASNEDWINKAHCLIRTGLLPEVTAIQLACLLISKRRGRSEVRTTELTEFLKDTDYSNQSPATLVRSLEKRGHPPIEVLDERVGPRQELQFRLRPEAAEDLRRRLQEGFKESAA